ncbi:methylated-DNA--[protein]-cysteine S-methyltransferase [Alteromonas gilva]|uniref:Methylated-DNA--protein-cysteine methyltransferase n=1 Tax=Alteromonas gilva TaxID=2987522 RepID=A0ABT5KZ54_9ALTE|nr:methylated-DNA--[protein]-cysteine S-methyltransferase [Alteromonas gilva]MDC8829491.1 methylated-DNA--[protein]-cysteine S-methyltransferase [Alteromonas gilva]
MSQALSYLESPCGVIAIAGDDYGLTSVAFVEDATLPENPSLVTQQCCSQLAAYFAGTLKVFNLPLNPAGTAFQQRVWRQLSAIEYGQTTSYGTVATRLGQPTASRAVGMANGKNPLAIIVPCHRVIGSNGTLTGYAGGLTRKRFLLSLEGAL